MLQALNVSFIGNTAGLDGAAIYTTNLAVCSERISVLEQYNASYLLETSIFEFRLSNAFFFFFFDCHKVYKGFAVLIAGITM